ncbi:DUF7210 family protein [Bordetella bronchiseptica]|uniref:DUF7210 domain-containing protein n=1 Tax=Bordetella bronchiseptica (strain ATCC BAA-588 / NCTC 13252 / RB50) TaxID=257310 RepID=A0A0H3LKB9_BORBR|nr:hypothetical protein [Bordetella bronchiseptica]AMG88082.1 hypothetical protein AL472_09945 [Bordetella bronchiseptica]KDB74265.1 hypothetical protein AZ21_1696 [Bordetella bronchiseptica B20-10725633]KDD52230.1 hypothetical protein L533_1788 [Bordetella bronchiseptica OSU553]CAE32193.1 phage-related hypothetical protein [Bordetella bronchiseptica RB50]
MKVIAKCSFEHNGTRKAGDEFDVSDQAARLLEAKGLVDLSGMDDDDQEKSQSATNAAVGGSAAGDDKPVRRRAARRG